MHLLRLALKMPGTAELSNISSSVPYRYWFVSLDCGYSTGLRDSNNRLTVNTTKYPSGMKALGDYIHSKGLKFGMCQSCASCLFVVVDDAFQTPMPGHSSAALGSIRMQTMDRWATKFRMLNSLQAGEWTTW